MIGLFDSGLGGLSVARAVRSVLPRHTLHYLADSAHCPYGPQPPERIVARSLACTRWLVQQGAQLLVVACNTATSAAIEAVRAELLVPVVGMEPGVKPAVAATRSGKVAVLATSGTLGGSRFSRLVDRFAEGIEVRTVACPGLVQLVEEGALNGPQALAAVCAYVEPLVREGFDTLVLGCTHFPPLRHLIAAVAPEATIIDTGPAVAARTAQIVTELGLAPGVGVLRCFTTGNPQQVDGAATAVWGAELAVEGVKV
jgi:glutamate racemase